MKQAWSFGIVGKPSRDALVELWQSPYTGSLDAWGSQMNLRMSASAQHRPSLRAPTEVGQTLRFWKRDHLTSKRKNTT